MSELTYTRMLSSEDADISRLVSVYRLPAISRYLKIGKNYFRYVTATENVYFYKIYAQDRLIGAIHLEKQGKLLYMSILVFPAHQGMGFGKRIVKDILDDIFELNYERIEIAIDKSNAVSRRLFENAGFVLDSEDSGLLNYFYQK